MWLARAFVDTDPKLDAVPGARVLRADGGPELGSGAATVEGGPSDGTPGDDGNVLDLQCPGWEPPATCGSST